MVLFSWFSVDHLVSWMADKVWVTPLTNTAKQVAKLGDTRGATPMRNASIQLQYST